MTTGDYLLDIVLIGVVFLQIRGRRLTPHAQLLPLGIVAVAASNYLHGVPTAGNDLLLIVGCAVVGSLLGALCAWFTSVRAGADGFPVAKAGALAATFWILGVGSRFAFQLYASHGGGAAIERFSASHSITSTQAWTAALILMAIGEVVFRTAILAWRGYTVRREPGSGQAATPAGSSWSAA